MKRRKFLVLGSIFGLATCVKAKEVTHFEKMFKEVEPTLRAVQEHLFPEGSKIPSAKSMKLTQFMYDTMKHKSFDRDIKAFVLNGATELEKRVGEPFVSLSIQQKEKALRDYEKTEYGRNWLLRIMTLSMEGLFSDPIYGSNIQEAGWKAIASYGGFPRPRSRYIGL
jgi:gluconate 2-dehydrogenase gamma chain